MNVVLVHGIFDNGSIFRHLVHVLKADGHTCWVPALKPSDGRKGIHSLAVQLKAYIERHIEPDTAIAIVGFSMGCLVSRQYMQILGGANRTKAFFAISGPHDGTLTAYLYIGQGARDMRPRSELLNTLNQSAQTLDAVPLFAYWTSRDVTIFPASSSDWHLASYRLDAKALLHRLMPHNEQVCRDIQRRIRNIDSELTA